MARVLPGRPLQDSFRTVVGRGWSRRVDVGEKGFHRCVCVWTFLLDGKCPSRRGCGGQLSLVLLVTLSNVQRSVLHGKHAPVPRVGRFSAVLSDEFLVLLGHKWNSVHILFIIVHG